MALAIKETVKSRRQTTGDNANMERKFVIRGTNDDVVAKEMAEAETELVFRGLARQSVSVDPLVVDANGDSSIWDVTVNYGVKEVTNEPRYSFRTTGGTQRITQSLETVRRYGVTVNDIPDFQGAIGVSHDDVEGTEIIVPTFTWSETRFWPSAFVTPAFVNRIEQLTGKANLTALTHPKFGLFTPAEVLFLGASNGSQRGTDEWEITYDFAVSRSKTDINVGPFFNIEKLGWEYMWVRYEDAVEAIAGAVVKHPRAVYIEKVYEYGDFADLGFETYPVKIMLGR